MSIDSETEVTPLRLEDSVAKQSHLFFRFPGKIHPPLVAEILAKHPDLKDVADPMVGSGTVAVESVAAAREGLFMDIDPLACLISRAKATPIESSRLCELVEHILHEAHPLPGPKECTRQQARMAIENLEAETKFHAPPNVHHWFKPYVVLGLCRVLLAASSILGTASAQEQDAVLAIIASSIRRVSNADPSPVSGLEVTKIRRQRLESGLTFNVQKRIEERLEVLAESYEELLGLDEIGAATVVNSDVKVWSTLCSKMGFSPQLIICSPPYCHAIEYWRRHRLEYFWLGLVEEDGLSDLKYRFVGTTRIRNNSHAAHAITKSVDRLIKLVEAKDTGTSGRLLRQYFIDTKSWLSECYSSLDDDGYLYAVVGSCTVRGVAVTLPALLQELAVDVGFDLVDTHSYALINKSMQFPTRNSSSISLETVLMLQR